MSHTIAATREAALQKEAQRRVTAFGHSDPKTNAALAEFLRTHQLPTPAEKAMRNASLHD